MIHKEIKSDAMLVHFDLAGLEVSTGSACTSGSLRPSETLLAMGFDKGASQNIRISLGPSNGENQDEIISKLKSVLEKL